MAERQADFPIIRDSQGEITNPTTSTVLADTGYLGFARSGIGFYEVLVVASATANAQFQVQLRNELNDTNIDDVHIFYCPANRPVSVPMRFFVESERYRIRVLPDNSLTGDAAVSLFVQRVA